MSKMKISSGKSRGMKLNFLKNDNLRPTKDRVKESLFNILQFEIKNKNFLDLFGGTGQIGIEAFSRGAKNIFIVDKNNESIKIINENINKIKIPHDNIKVVKNDAISFLETATLDFDIVFLDPPYEETQLLNDCIEILSKKLNKNAIIISETIFSENAQKDFNYFSLKKTYKYGRISLNLYKNAEN